MRSITADWSLLRRSGAAFLGALPQLEELYVHQGGIALFADGSVWQGSLYMCDWFWEWLERHAPLRSVTLKVDSELALSKELEGQASEAGAGAGAWELHPPELARLRPRLARLAERRPGLKVECVQAYDDEH